MPSEQETAKFSKSRTSSFFRFRTFGVFFEIDVKNWKPGRTRSIAGFENIPMPVSEVDAKKPPSMSVSFTPNAFVSMTIPPAIKPDEEYIANGSGMNVIFSDTLTSIFSVGFPSSSNDGELPSSVPSITSITMLSKTPSDWSCVSSS